MAGRRIHVVVAVVRRAHVGGDRLRHWEFAEFAIVFLVFDGDVQESGWTMGGMLMGNGCIEMLISPLTCSSFADRRNSDSRGRTSPDPAI